MPVKHGLLALLAEAPGHGYQLKSEFESRTGGSWELNIGQVYSTLQRLERDGLVVAGEMDDDERRVHEITAAGRTALDTWYRTPIVASPPPRDELAIKILIAMASPGVDVQALVQRQRVAMIEQLQALTRRKRDLDPAHDLASLLHLDALIFKAEAEVRWLDTCDARLRQRPLDVMRSGGPDPNDGPSAGGPVAPPGGPVPQPNAPVPQPNAPVPQPDGAAASPDGPDTGSGEPATQPPNAVSIPASTTHEGNLDNQPAPRTDGGSR